MSNTKKKESKSSDKKDNSVGGKKWQTPSSNTQSLSDLLFYQYLIKTHSPEKPGEEISPSLKKAYETYKTVLSRVIDDVRVAKEEQSATEKSMREKDALEQLRRIEHDTLLLKKSMLIHSSRDIGIESLSRQIVSLQKQIVKKMLEIPESSRMKILRGSGKKKNNKKKEEKKKENQKQKEVDSSDEEVVLEDPVDDIIVAEVDFSKDFMMDSDDDDELLVEEKPIEEKVISFTGPLPKSFQVLNTTEQETHESNDNTEEDDSIYPIEYFHKTKDYGWLSTFNQAPFLYLGKQYPTVEHAFNAQKCSDDDYQNMFVMNSDSFIGPDALKAKTAGCDNSFKTSQYVKKADWDSTRVACMKDCTKECLNQNPEIMEKLLRTGKHPLHHTGFKVGTFWGMQKGKGLNHHGKILMEIRDQPEE